MHTIGLLNMLWLSRSAEIHFENGAFQKRWHYNNHVFFFKHKSKMTDDCLVFKFLWCGVNRKQVIRYQRKKNAVFNFLRRRAGRGLSTNKLNPRQANYRETRNSRVRHEIFIRHTKDNFDIRTEVAPSRLVTEIDSSKAGIILSTILYLDHQVWYFCSIPLFPKTVRSLFKFCQQLALECTKLMKGGIL